MAGYSNQSARFWTCVCGKRAYSSRSDAKAAMKQLKKGGNALNIYQCSHWDGASNAFHIGHLWASVKNGNVSRDNMWQAVRR